MLNSWSSSSCGPTSKIHALCGDSKPNLFIKAIEETVTPDDVVLDLGTGSGILAVAAARAGARHVYALEPARSGDLAAKVIAHNGYADKVTMIRGWSTTTELMQIIHAERATERVGGV